MVSEAPASSQISLKIHLSLVFVIIFLTATENSEIRLLIANSFLQSEITLLKCLLAIVVLLESINVLYFVFGFAHLTLLSSMVTNTHVVVNLVLLKRLITKVAKYWMVLAVI